MDVFTHLNYNYPGAFNAARPHFSPRQQAAHRPVSIPNTPSMQDQTHPVGGYARYARSSAAFAASYDSRSEEQNSLVSPGGAVFPDSKPPFKIGYTAESASFSDQYVPSSSDRLTCTDHRPLDDIFGNLPPSPGWPQAISGLSYPSHPLQNGRLDGHPPRPPVLTYTLPTKPQLQGVVQIPLLAVDNQMSGTGLVVDFRCSDWGIGVVVEGISMSELLRGDESDLEGPHDRVLDGLGICDLRFHILWPHYPPFMKVISAFGIDKKPMTRVQLGYEVSLAFAEFFYQITSLSISPTQSGPYAIASSYPGSTPPGIKFEELYLITVRNTSRGEWMAEVRSISMPCGDP